MTDCKIVTAAGAQAERWFGFRFVIVGSRGRRGGSTAWSDGACAALGGAALVWPGKQAVGVVSQGELSELGVIIRKKHVKTSHHTKF